MTHLNKVTMNLTDRDVQNTESLRDRFHARSNAEAVSVALNIASSLTSKMANGDELLIRSKNGEVDRVIIPGLERNDR